MALHPLAGKPPEPGMLVNAPRLVAAYYTEKPDVSVAAQKVSFGTSGHRGSSFLRSFNEAHILAITQAICEYRAANSGPAGRPGPLFLAMDTHALSEPAFCTALETLAANGVDVMIDQSQGYTPTPALSHAVLAYNRGRSAGLADGIVLTPSHNPPEDGGIKYNPPHGGPAAATVTNWIEDRANQILAAGLAGVAASTFFDNGGTLRCCRRDAIPKLRDQSAPRPRVAAPGICWPSKVMPERSRSSVMACPTEA